MLGKEEKGKEKDEKGKEKENAYFEGNKKPRLALDSLPSSNSRKPKSAPVTPRKTSEPPTVECAGSYTGASGIPGKKTEDKPRKLVHISSLDSFGSFLSGFKNRDKKKQTLPIPPPQVSFTDPAIFYDEPSEKNTLPEEEPQTLNYSLILNNLLDKNKYPELYRRAMPWDELQVANKKKSDLYQSYAWHTPQSILVLKECESQFEFLELQTNKIELIRVLYEDILEPVFQHYLEETKDIERQASHFCEFMRKRLDAAMQTATLLNNYPAVTQVLSYKDKLFYLPEDVKFAEDEKDELYFPAFKERAQLQLFSLRLHKMKNIAPSMNVILPYIIDGMNVKKYEETFEKLSVMTKMVAISDWYHQKNIENLNKDIEKGEVPGFVSLSSQLPLEKTLKNQIISLLAAEIKDQLYQENNPSNQEKEEEACHNVPKIEGNERELFIAEASDLLISLQKTISQFWDKHAKSLAKKDGAMTARSRDIIIKDLPAALMNVFMPPNQNDKKSSYKFCLK